MLPSLADGLVYIHIPLEMKALDETSCSTYTVLSSVLSPDDGRELDESLAQMEAQIFHDEGSYIKETPCGNVIRGFEAFHDRCVPCALSSAQPAAGALLHVCLKHSFFRGVNKGGG